MEKRETRRSGRVSERCRGRAAYDSPSGLSGSRRGGSSSRTNGSHDSYSGSAGVSSRYVVPHSPFGPRTKCGTRRLPLGSRLAITFASDMTTGAPAKWSARQAIKVSRGSHRAAVRDGRRPAGAEGRHERDARECARRLRRGRHAHEPRELSTPRPSPSAFAYSSSGGAGQYIRATHQTSSIDAAGGRLRWSAPHCPRRMRTGVTRVRRLRSQRHPAARR